jgi:hypothetical protein
LEVKKMASKVELTKGYYYTSSPIAVNKDGVYLTGSGTDVTSISVEAAGIDGIVLGDGTTMRSSLGVSNLRMISAVGKTAGAGILVNKCMNATLEKLRINNQYHGVRVTNNGNLIVRILHSEIRSMIVGSGLGLLIEGGSLIVDDLNLGNSVGNEPYASIQIRNLGDGWFNNVNSVYGGQGLAIDPQNAQAVNFLFISKSAFDVGTGPGICLYPAAGGIVSSLNFIDCWTSGRLGASGYGILLGGAGTINGIEFIGHRALNNNRDGAMIETGTDWVFNGGTFAGNSAAVANTYDGIAIAANISGFSIQGVRAGNGSGMPDTQRYGIVVNTGSSNNYRIIGNDLRGNQTDRLYDGGTGSVKVIKNNLGYNPVGDVFSPAIPASTVAYTNAYGQDCQVTIYDGTVTVININGTVTGLTTGTFIVPAGGTITITYSAAPTWTWNRN